MTVIDNFNGTMDAIWAIPASRLTGMYGNFSMRSGPSILERMYPPATRERLRRAKRRYDPDNVFARNHNISAV